MKRTRFLLRVVWVGLIVFGLFIPQSIKTVYSGTSQIKSIIPADFKRECVFCIRESSQFRLTNQSLKIDNLGNPHIVNSESYYWKDISGWHSEVFDQYASRSQLFLDANGSPYILYQHQDGYLKLARKDGNSWTIEQIYHLQYNHYESDPSFTFDHAGNPYVTFVSNDQLMYGYRDQTGWNIQQITYPLFDESSAVMLVLDKSSHPHILSYYFAGPVTVHFYWDGSTWHHDEVPGFGFPLALFIDADDKLHLVDSIDGQIQLIIRDSGGWQTTTDVIDPNNYSYSLSAALDSNGFLRLLYIADSDSTIHYAQQSPAGWSLTTLSFITNPDIGLPLAIDPQGNSQLAFVVNNQGGYYPDMNVLKYAKEENGNWLPAETVKENDFRLRMTAMAFDNSGAPYVTFSTVRLGFVIAKRDAQGWVTEKFDPSDIVGTNSQIAIGSDNQPQVIYMAQTGDLRYAHKVNGVWQISTFPDIQIALDDRLTMKLDSLNHPHFVNNVLVGNSHELRYYSYDGTVWTYETFAQNATFSSPSLTITSTGLPAIFYLKNESGTSNAIFSYKNASGWHDEIVDNQTSSYDDEKLAIDTNGNPHVVYNKNNVLIYAHRQGNIWIKEELPDWSGDPFLVLGPGDRPVIALQASSSGKGILTVITKRNGIWQEFPTLSKPDDSLWTPLSLLTNPEGNPAFLLPWGSNILDFLEIDPFPPKLLYLPVIKRN